METYFCYALLLDTQQKHIFIILIMGCKKYKTKTHLCYSNEGVQV